ncbi:MAG: hypothetical protein WC676_03085 [Candidatus Omnitrophota bacterium]
MNILIKNIRFIIIVLAVFLIYQYAAKYFHENKILKEMVARLEADSRGAQVLVTNVSFDEQTGRNLTTIKFQEFDAQQKPLAPKYFTFSGNLIQFQSLVIRFDDIRIRQADKFRGKSAYLFMKVFVLDGKNTQVFDIAKVNEVPLGYQIDGASHFEKRLWERFWGYALNADQAKDMGIKNAQIEAPGTVFVPGTLYTIKIEHDGGLRIEAQALPEILKGERIGA